MNLFPYPLSFLLSARERSLRYNSKIQKMTIINGDADEKNNNDDDDDDDKYDDDD